MSFFIVKIEYSVVIQFLYWKHNMFSQIKDGLKTIYDWSMNCHHEKMGNLNLNVIVSVCVIKNVYNSK